MAKDDYKVIVFKTLQYLYRQLKDGKKPDPEMLRHDSKIFRVNEVYWKYILTSMQEEGQICGLDPGKEVYDDSQLEQIRITPKGINTLTDNAMIKKLRQLIQGVIKI